MDQRQRARARELLLAQEVLLIAVALGERDPEDADPEYKERHRELRTLLAIDTLACLCPWGSVMPWAYGGYEDWRAELDRLRGPLRGLINEGGSPHWRLVLYRRGGSADDLPFSRFEESLTDEQWVVLDASLQLELGQEGTGLLRNHRQAHNMSCGGRPRPRPVVLMYKIREGAPSGEVVLRIFFDTAPDHTIILLHGYDKGADPSERRETAEAEVACGYRRDLLAQLADPHRAGPALASLRE